MGARPKSSPPPKLESTFQNNDDDDDVVGGWGGLASSVNVNRGKHTIRLTARLAEPIISLGF